MVWFGLPALFLGASVLGLTVARRLTDRRRDALWAAVQPFRLSRRATLEDLAVMAHDAPDDRLDRAREAVLDAVDEEGVRGALVALRAARSDLDPPCGFDPTHGSAGDPTCDLPACTRCAEVPQPRLVRHGDRLVPWFAAGSAYDAYAHGWFGDALDPFRVEAARLVAWDDGVDTVPGYLDVKMGAGWYGVLLAANHRQGKFSSG